LPLSPSANSFKKHKVKEVVFNDENGRLKLTLKTESSDFKAGMLLKLEYKVSVGGNFLPIDFLMIDEVRGKNLFIMIDDTPLALHKTGIIRSAEVKISASTTFLADVPFRLIKGTDQDGIRDDQCKVTCSDFPALAEIDDEIILFAKSGEPVTYKIACIDRFQHTLTLSGITADDIKDNQYCYLKQTGSTERFSFMVSIVLNKQVLNDWDKDKWREVEGWIKEILYFHMSSHCHVLIHWLEKNTFNSLTGNLKRWIKYGYRIGITSYKILETLTLGRMPPSQGGIGNVLIVKQDQVEEMKEMKDKQNYIDQLGIFQVNPKSL